MDGESRRLDDAQKALLLGTYLLAAALTWDSERGIYEERSGELIAMIPVDEKYVELAREAFTRESVKPSVDDHTELFVAWIDDEAGHVLVEWHVLDPESLSSEAMKTIPRIKEKEDEAQET